MGLIRSTFSEDLLTIWAIENRASEDWLINYANQMGITYPFIFDASSEIFDTYQVGLSFGTIPPNYFILDQNGIVQYRIDGIFDRFEEMKAKIEELLDQ
jgi:hypothetical protein